MKNEYLYKIILRFWLLVWQNKHLEGVTLGSLDDCDSIFHNIMIFSKPNNQWIDGKRKHHQQMNPWKWWLAAVLYRISPPQLTMTVIWFFNVIYNISITVTRDIFSVLCTFTWSTFFLIFLHLQLLQFLFSLHFQFVASTWDIRLDEMMDDMCTM